MEWTKEDIKEIIRYCKENNIQKFSWSAYCFEFSFDENTRPFLPCAPIPPIDAGKEMTPDQMELKIKEIEKKKQEAYNDLMFMSST